MERVAAYLREGADALERGAHELMLRGQFHEAERNKSEAADYRKVADLLMEAVNQPRKS